MPRPPRPARPPWTPIPPQPPRVPPPERLRVLSFNVLFDLYEPERVRLDARWQALVAVLTQAEADLIALQELTPVMWARLRAEPALAAHWASAPADGAALGRYGQVLLSRWPLRRCAVRPLPPNKTAVLGELAWGDRAVHAVVVHLSSDLHADGVSRRRVQLLELARALEELPDPVLLLGDFNFGDEEPALALRQAGFVDLWPLLNPGDPGLSFDPARNHLAAGLPPEVSARRLDRVWLRDRAGMLEPRRITLIGTDPVPGVSPPLHPSDHFGVLAELGALG